MSLEQDVAAAREAVDYLERACLMVTRHFGETVDARRLKVDVSRMRDDLDLLCGARPRQSRGDASGAAVWGDGFDEGPTAPRRTAP